MNKYMDDFINYLEYERNYSNNTIIAYKNDIIEFIDYLDTKRITNISDIDYDTIRTYLSYLYDNKYKAKSISRMISSLRSFFKYLKLNNIITNNPMTLISNPKVEKKLPKYLTINEVESILNAPDMNDPVGIRDAFILELLYVSGIRVSELVNIKLNDIEESQRRIKILGKGNKERYVLYGSRCSELLKKYISVRFNFLKYPNDYLILSKTGRKINTREIRNIINRIKTKAGISISISPHTFRHTFATRLINGVKQPDGSVKALSVKQVAELLGHTTSEITEIYYVKRDTTRLAGLTDNFNL